MVSPRSIRGPLLNPQPDGSVAYTSDAVLAWDVAGRFTYVGDADHLSAAGQAPRSRGLLIPAMLDAHIHIPQWPIRGKFCDGVNGCPEGGRLLAGLERNVFPFEARCADAEHARTVVADFARDTLSHGVVGGAAYMTVHASAVNEALSQLGPAWSVGLVLMNMNCPAYLRTAESHLDRDVAQLAERFGRRLIVTDRFAVAVDSPLRQHGARLAKQFGLRMQTHLDEQPAEKRFVEETLYPQAASYTDVYARDGLLGCDPILAHCIHVGDEELDLIAGSGAAVAHCPTSNALLGSGIMPLDRIIERRIPYSICTDVGASPTTSLLCEMAEFLKVHAGRSTAATPSEALFRVTRGAAQVLHLEDTLGHLAVGRPATFVEAGTPVAGGDADEVILRGLLRLDRSQLNAGAERSEFSALAGGGLQDADVLRWLAEDVDRTAADLAECVHRVTVNGRVAFERA